jgi:hypothetical protein
MSVLSRRAGQFSSAFASTEPVKGSIFTKKCRLRGWDDRSQLSKNRSARRKTIYGNVYSKCSRGWSAVTEAFMSRFRWL